MRIIIDCRMYGLENAGIGRYIINLVDQIEKLDKKNDYYLLFRRKYYSELTFSNPKFHKILADYPHYSLKEQIFLPIQLFKLKPDLVHFPHFNVTLFYFRKFVVTIHDLIKHSSRGIETTTHNSWLYWFKYLGYKIVFSQAVKRADTIFVPSQQVKKELVANYHLFDNKILVTYEGVDNNFKKEERSGILEKYEIRKPFIIYTGSVYPHKNIDRLIQSIKLIEKPLDLVISCSRNIFWDRLNEKIKTNKVENRVRLLGFVPDQELRLLYTQARAFVFPTLSEGFGLPGLEAMASGCPVICSNLPVLKEIYGNAAVYFDPYDINNMTKSISDFCFGEKENKEKMKRLGLDQVKKYSWKKMAKETIHEYFI